MQKNACCGGTDRDKRAGDQEVVVCDNKVQWRSENIVAKIGKYLQKQ
jgi:hypothetical protein